MGYSFERVRTASREREQGVIGRTVRAIREVSGATIRGWRCPDYRVSPQTLDILSAEGFVWDSSILNDDLPYLVDCEAGPIVEIPFTTSTADKTFAAFPYPMSGGPEGLADAWASEFEVLYQESGTSPRFMTISMQTWVAGRPSTLHVLKQFIRSLKSYNDVQFTHCSDLISCCLQSQVEN
jgi:peptidoglycan/xylan/chitin deacetylase (PgdA/CDA1 family)